MTGSVGLICPRAWAAEERTPSSASLSKPAIMLRVAGSVGFISPRAQATEERRPSSASLSKPANS